MTVLEWLYALIGEASSNTFEFIYVIVACICVVIAFTCALSMFIGIVFAIFKR